ncbi:DUF4239 domain-containing protein [Umezawaea beigongshangensis]|uniref:bestrophin-like domain n=1 Tax=Umezawaea beigongshangensis TaxID=2780383 RepID=UPI0018F16EFE|nr:DUF4239 domain-containing protein [Umezawaea beigongshangensis]
MSFFSAVAVVVPVVLAIVATIVAGRLRRASEGQFDGDSASFVGGVLNALFVVVLAFYVVFAWEAGNDVHERSATESAALVDAYWQVAAAPEQERDQLRGLIRDYTTRVVDQEWSLLERGRADPGADELLVSLRAGVAALPVEDEKVKSAREHALRDVRQVVDSRRERVAVAGGGDALLQLLLVGAVAGAVLMVAFPLVIGFSAGVRHVLVVGVLALALALVLWVSIELGHPFSGVFAVQPDAFRAALVEFSVIP